MQIIADFAIVEKFVKTYFVSCKSHFDSPAKMKFPTDTPSATSVATKFNGNFFQRIRFYKNTLLNEHAVKVYTRMF